jgi:hypothetical protein
MPKMMSGQDRISNRELLREGDFDTNCEGKAEAEKAGKRKPTGGA